MNEAVRLLRRAEAARLLRRAAALIDEATPLLNDGAAPCCSCGTSRYQDWTEHKAKEAVAPLAERLRKTAGALEARQDSPSPGR